MKKFYLFAVALTVATSVLAVEEGKDVKQQYPNCKVTGWIKVTYQDTIYKDTNKIYPSGFEVKDAGVVISGEAWTNIGYSLYLQGNRASKVNDKEETPLASGESVLSTRLVGAYIDWKIAKAANIRMGQFKKPMGMEQWTSPVNYDFINVSQLTKNFISNTYDQGIMFFGKKEQLSYWLSLFNGSLYDYKDKNTAKNTIAKVVYVPMAGLTTGGSLEYGTQNLTGKSLYSRRVGVEVNWEWRKLMVRSEYMIGSDDKALSSDSVMVDTAWIKRSGTDANLMRSTYLTVGCLPLPNLRVMARADMYRQNYKWDLATDGSNVWWDKSESRVMTYTLGTDYSLNSNAKVFLNYEIRQEDLALRPVKNNVLMAQFQAKF